MRCITALWRWLLNELPIVATVWRRHWLKPIKKRAGCAGRGECTFVANSRGCIRRRAESWGGGAQCLRCPLYIHYTVNSPLPRTIPTPVHPRRCKDCITSKTAAINIHILFSSITKTSECQQGGWGGPSLGSVGVVVSAHHWRFRPRRAHVTVYRCGRLSSGVWARGEARGRVSEHTWCMGGNVQKSWWMASASTYVSNPCTPSVTTIRC